MPGFFRKTRRRPAAGPNKNEQKVLRNEREARTLPLRTVYPSVHQLSIQLDFLSPQQHILGQETRVLNASDVCDLKVPCPGRCGNGSFDLQAKIDKVIQSKQGYVESSGKCELPLYLGASEVCGCTLRCKIKVSYVPDAA
jgi:hypothetical protein